MKKSRFSEELIIGLLVTGSVGLAVSSALDWPSGACVIVAVSAVGCAQGVENIAVQPPCPNKSTSTLNTAD